MKTKKMVMSAVFAALTFVATMVIPPIRLSPNGYVNIGDCMVIASGIFLGPLYGAVAAGIGSVLADLIGGYFIYAPATLVIKGLMAFLVSKISKNNSIFAVIIASFVAELVMVIGYFLYEIIIIGLPAALLGMPGNFLQAGFGVVGSIVLYVALSKNKYIKNQINY